MQILLLGGEWLTWTYRGLAVLLIACPCALVISVPAAMASGLSAGARRGLLVKGGAALEAVGKVATVALDKTGTLTAGRPCLTDLQPADGVEEAALLRAAAWGRCVAAAAPDMSRAYVDTRRPDPALRPVFRSCLRTVGDFRFSNWGDIRRAALSDALSRGDRS